MSDAVSPQNFRKALLVEDEPALATSMEIALRKLHIDHLHVATLAQARDAIELHAFDLILLDRMLPDGDGIGFCREVRSEGFHGSILMLTALGDIDSKVDGLTSGADDYLPKPFDWAEFSARVQALARRHYARPSVGGETSAGLWQRNPQRLRIRGPLGWAELTPLEFKLACFLMDAEGAIVTREALLKEVWGFTLLPKTRTVDHFLGRLRKFFEKDPETPAHFLTVRGAGYRFEP